MFPKSDKRFRGPDDLFACLRSPFPLTTFRDEELLRNRFFAGECLEEKMRNFKIN